MAVGNTYESYIDDIDDQLYTISNNQNIIT